MLTTQPVQTPADVEVHVVSPSLGELAAAALEIRKQHPRARLIVAGPARLVRELERRYPPLVDVAIPEPTREAIAKAVEP